MSKTKVAFFVFNTGNGDLRVHRQASLLAKNGYEVRIYCFLEPGLPQTEQRAGYKIVREDQRPAITRFWDDKLMSKLRRSKKTAHQPERVRPPIVPEPVPVRPCPLPPPRQLPMEASGDDRQYLAYVRAINRIWAERATSWKPDFCQAHDLDSLEAACWTAERCEARLLYDSHELWTDQPFLRSQEVVDYWDSLEAALIRQCDAVLTVSRPFAEVMKQRYKVEVTPLHNCQEYAVPRPGPPLRERVGGRPVALYQGVYGEERGLEQLVASAAHQSEVIVALRGYGPAEPAIRALAVGKENVLLLDPCRPDEIVDRAAEADLGVIPFLPTCLNHYYNTPNKLFEYMMAGLPIASADLPDLRHFIEGERIGTLFDPFSPADMARGIVELARNPQLPAMRERALEAARLRYNWEVEGKVLLDCYRSLAK